MFKLRSRTRGSEVFPPGRILPIDLGPQHKQLRMNPDKIRPVEVRRVLKHVDPVGHEADPDIGIPVEAKSKIRLPAALDVGRGAERLEEKEAAIVQIDFADPGSKLPCAPCACVIK
jgi:hypothetical protein